MMLLDPRFWLALFVALGGAYATGRWQQYQSDEKTHTAEIIKATEKARQTEANWQSDAAVAEGIHDEEIARINDRLADALERLRKRPDRLPAAATTACEGATGAQLSGPDAGFLEREAARADSLRAALGECYGWIDAVRR